MRGREEFLASAITSASTGGGSGFVVGGSGTERERDRGHSAGMFGRIMVSVIMPGYDQVVYIERWSYQRGGLIWKVSLH